MPNVDAMADEDVESDINTLPRQRWRGSGRAVVDALVKHLLSSGLPQVIFH